MTDLPNLRSFAAKLYCDFDGIVNAKLPQHEDVAEAHIEVGHSEHLAPVTQIIYSPTVVNKLELFRTLYRIELVWLTTWNEFDHILKVAEPMKGLDNGRVLPAALNKEAKTKAEWTAWKAEAILEDQKADPSPFIWIDDNAVTHWGEMVSEATHSTSSLFIIPNSLWGLTTTNLESIEAFMKDITS